MRNTGMEDTQAGIKIAGRNINNLRRADDTTLMAEPPRISKAAEQPAFGVDNPKYTINQLCLCVIIHLLQPQFSPI